MRSSVNSMRLPRNVKTFRRRIDKSRETPQLATTALLAYATPDLSSYMLSFLLGPFYEAEGKKDIAIAVYEEAIKFSDAATRRELEEKIKKLRGN